MTLLSLNSFAVNVSEGLSAIEARIPELNIVNYKKIVTMKPGDSLTADEYQFGSPHGRIQKSVECSDSSVNIQALRSQQKASYFGISYLGPADAKALGGILYVCNE